MKEGEESYLYQEYVGSHFVFYGLILVLVEKTKAKTQKEPSHIILNGDFIGAPLPEVISHGHRL